MKIESIQVGLPKTVEFRGQSVTTGIFKEPVSGPVMVRTLNLDGDKQADLSVHGGTFKAVYAYSMDALPWWRQARPQDTFGFGSFGENLSVDTLPEDQICIGDTFAAGGAVLQAVQPRFPCFKLGVKFNDPSILRTFNDFRRPGVYFRVLQEGVVQAGDELKLAAQEADRISVRQLFSVFLEKTKDPILLRRLLGIEALPPLMRERFEEILGGE